MGTGQPAHTPHSLLAADRVHRDPLGEAERPGEGGRRGLQGGLRLRVDVARHRQVVVLTNLSKRSQNRREEKNQLGWVKCLGHLVIVGVHPVDWPLPVTSSTAHHPGEPTATT